MDLPLRKKSNFHSTAMVLAKTIILFVLLHLFIETLAEKLFDWHFHQNDYHFKLERAEVTYYNKDYMKIAKIVSFRYNRTFLTENATLQFKIDVGSDLEVIAQSYKFASNEYRLFPVRLGDKICRVYDADVAGAKQITRCGNVTQCFFVKDIVYHVCYIKPDESKLPPYIPTGRYMAEVELNYKSINLAVAKVYGEIVRPEVSNL